MENSTYRDRLQKGESPDDILNDSRKLIDFDESIGSSEASTPPTSILRNSIYVGRSNVDTTVVVEGRPGDQADAALKGLLDFIDTVFPPM